jgi:hypothetical protein
LNLATKQTNYFAIAVGRIGITCSTRGSYLAYLDLLNTYAKKIAKRKAYYSMPSACLDLIEQCYLTLVLACGLMVRGLKKQSGFLRTKHITRFSIMGVHPLKACQIVGILI